MGLDFSVVLAHISLFSSGLAVTAGISAFTFIASALLAAFGIAGRLSKRVSLRAAMRSYVEVLRNVPILVLIYICFYGLPQSGIPLTAINATLIALTANSTAYMIEIYRGGVLGIPTGQREAAEALGLHPSTIWQRIILPQAIIIAFPAIGNQLVAVILGSSLAVLVGAGDLTFVAYNVGANTYHYFEVFIFVALIYFLLVQGATKLWTIIGERSFSSQYGVWHV